MWCFKSHFGWLHIKIKDLSKKKNIGPHPSLKLLVSDIACTWRGKPPLPWEHQATIKVRDSSTSQNQTQQWFTISTAHHHQRYLLQDLRKENGEEDLKIIPSYGDRLDKVMVLRNLLSLSHISTSSFFLIPN